jgi:hypothetical protein
MTILERESPGTTRGYNARALALVAELVDAQG